MTNADVTYPVDVMRWRDRWLLLDGLHRLMRHILVEAPNIKTREVPVSAIPLIIKRE